MQDPQTGMRQIGLATSTDGFNWIKYSDNPILTPNQSWEGGNIGNATVLQTNTEYNKTYYNRNSGIVGMAYSNDGIHLTKDASNPVFSASDFANHGCSKVSYPYSVKIGNNYRLYYTGLGSDGQLHLAVAFGQ